MDNKIIEYRSSDAKSDYKFWSGDGGREVTRRMIKYKQKIVSLYCFLGVSLIINISLIIYIYNLFNKGF